MAYQIQYTSTPITYSSTLAPTGTGPSGSNPGGYAPIIYPPPIASASPASISHIVALAEQNREYFDNNTSTFTKMRVTIHTTGAWAGSVHSDNHVTILLILNSGGAVQLDMRTDDGDRRGQLQWKLVNYQHSSSEIKSVDYELGAPVQVMTLYRAIRNDWNLHQYLFSAGGSGCHYWKYVHSRWSNLCHLLLTQWSYVLLCRIAGDTERFSLNAEVPDHAWGVFGTWYSRSGAERPNSPIRQGQFQNYTDWWNDWFTPDEDEDEDEDENE